MASSRDAPDDDALELGDDAIVAAQSIVHAPQPRARVAPPEAALVVVTDEASRSLPAYSPGRADKTVVVPKKSGGRARPGAAPPASKGWTIWIVAGAAAFGVGGVLAWVSAPKAAPPPAQAQAPSPVVTEAPRAAEHFPPPKAAEPEPAATAAAVVDDMPAPERKAEHRATAGTPAPVPATVATGAPPAAAPKPKAAPAKAAPASDIPEGI